MMRSLLLSLGLGLVLNSTAQSVPHDHRTCGSHTITERHLQQQGLPTDLLHQLPSAQPLERGGTLTIPVVVHVVWNTAAENVPTATVNAIIAELNADFGGTNSDINQVRPTFNGVVDNPGFQFCLAQVAPNGSATTGIVRVQTTDTWFNPDTETDNMKSAPTGSPAWDPTRYLNIWICDITSGATGGTITVGYAYLPVGGVVGTSIDGLVIDYDYGTQPGARTATHEIGHYFGLLHTFDDEGACVNADGFVDTPTSNSPTFSCSNTNLTKCGVLTQYENFMDYSDCTVMFTAQQSAYMTSILNSERGDLLLNNACSGPVTGICIPTSANGPADGDYINRVALGTINNANTGGLAGPAYTNYSTTLSTNLTRGTQYTVTVQGGTFNDDNVAAWIDYDQDETFEAGEKLGEVAITAANQTVTITFTVPTEATLGTTTLRVRNVFHNTGEPVPTDPCFSYSYGETEDYGISIQNSGGSGGACIPTSANGPADGDFVNTVLLNTLINGDSGGETEPAYTDFSSTSSTTLVRNGYYSIIVESGTYTTDSYAVWIDYDQDDVFEATEKLGQFSTSAANESQAISFEVPVNAPLGNTIMRVRGVFIGTGEPADVDPCFNYAYGETEDYGITIAAAPSVYCTPVNALGPVDGDFIDDVVLGNIVNLNTGGVQAPAYTDYSSTLNTTLERGSEYTLVIGSGDYTPDAFAAWIDMNLNGVFEPSESLGQFTNTVAGGSGELTFTVPMSASIGESRLRVRGQFVAEGEPDPIDPCYSYLYGETEDYKIFIQFSTSVTEAAAANVSVWPNPTTGLLNVGLGQDGSALIEVLDMQGRAVMTTSTTGRLHQLDASMLAAGTYVVRVSQSGAVSNSRIEVLKN